MCDQCSLSGVWFECVVFGLSVVWFECVVCD